MWDYHQIIGKYPELQVIYTCNSRWLLSQQAYNFVMVSNWISRKYPAEQINIFLTLGIRDIFKNRVLGGFNQSYQVKPTSSHIIKIFRVYHNMINVKKHAKYSTCAVKG